MSKSINNWLKQTIQQAEILKKAQIQLTKSKFLEQLSQDLRSSMTDFLLQGQKEQEIVDDIYDNQDQDEPVMVDDVEEQEEDGQDQDYLDEEQDYELNQDQDYLDEDQDYELNQDQEYLDQHDVKNIVLTYDNGEETEWGVDIQDQEQDQDLEEDQDYDLNEDQDYELDQDQDYDLNENQDLEWDQDYDLNQELEIDEDQDYDLNEDQDYDLNEDQDQELNQINKYIEEVLEQKRQWLEQEDDQQVEQLKKENQKLKERLVKVAKSFDKVNNTLKQISFIKYKGDLVVKLFQNVKGLNKDQKESIIKLFEGARNQRQAKLLYSSLKKTHMTSKDSKVRQNFNRNVNIPRVVKSTKSKITENKKPESSISKLRNLFKSRLEDQ